MHKMMARSDIAMIFVATDVADRIRPLMLRYSRILVPNILEIPTKLQPYDPNTDKITLLARVRLQLKRIFCRRLMNCFYFSLRLLFHQMISKSALM